MVEIVVNPGVVGVIVGLVDAVLDQRSEVKVLTEVLTQPRAVIAFVSGEDLQLVRLPAGELLADVGVTSLSGGRTVQIERITFVSVSTSFVALRSCTSYFVLLQYERLAGERSKYVASIAPIGPVL